MNLIRPPRDMPASDRVVFYSTRMFICLAIAVAAGAISQIAAILA